MRVADLVDTVHETWRPFIDSQRDLLTDIVGEITRDIEAGHAIAPSPSMILRAFQYPAFDVRVLIVGQDPYPTAGHATGLAFSVDPRTTPLPRSLVNIFRELHDDVGATVPGSGDLSAWAEDGVMLLNRALTVRVGEAGSMRSIGWDEFTAHAIQFLSDRGTPLVALLWGADARRATAHLGSTPIISSAHPSPLSAHRGFLGSRPFSRANAILIQQGARPVDWASLNSSRRLHF